jgi:hypothetical protein
VIENKTPLADGKQIARDNCLPPFREYAGPSVNCTLGMCGEDGGDVDVAGDAVVGGGGQ